MFKKLYNPNLRSEKKEVLTQDGTVTLYSAEFDECYHSTKDGALQESLKKHIIPASILCDKDSLAILDICFGLGYNTLATLYYYKRNFPNKKLHIISPELDKSLVQSLRNFKYPKEFEPFRAVIEAVSQNFFYEDENIKIEVKIGDAREVIRGIETKIDILYQDAFSPKKNPALWTKEYFADIKKIASKDIIITTYSSATPVRLAMYENGFKVYNPPKSEVRSGTIASLKKLDLEEIDMELKKQRNPNAKALSDEVLVEIIGDW